MWIRACVHVCVCVYQGSAVCVGSHQVNCESRLVTAGLVAGVERVEEAVWFCTGSHGFSLTRVLH